ncbi:hypothetical protein H634G_08604 [Metarhizium anisopliae BRIP 53293]|uniref:Adenylyl cyclase-associated protein n=1 Tax=Metarhizium anisopliae BRIP 53293 TaxID=1291518 RepID=A0A0D9NR15_METAN|nr:hypothetical protein H634G_08604 [Metarhizium anisopliae BRIP 53293]KJK91536.1 hypothetical protein H633G_04592 [Metarhizium anisopliae BRIP 53284]
MDNNRTMHNLSTIIKRLEAVVSRLEDLSVFDGPVLPSTLTDSNSEAIQAFDDFIDSSVKQYLLLSNRLGGLVAVQAAEVFKGFQEQRKFLCITTQAAKPDPATLETLLGPTKDAIVAVTDIQKKNRFDGMYVHLTAVADGIRMLAWVNIHSRPFVYVEESLGSAQFFGNKIFKNQKEKDKLEVEWIKSYYQVCQGLVSYVKLHFPTGITWNVRGGLVETVMGLS